MNKETETAAKKPAKAIAGEKLKGADKVARIPIKVKPQGERLRKPSWIRAKSPFHPNVKKLKSVLRDQKLHTVCEEAACPNLGECFGKGTATFMIMGDICTRRCPFCDVGHGRPLPPSAEEPEKLGLTIQNNVALVTALVIVRGCAAPASASASDSAG